MKIDELIQDGNNANKGTDEGAQMIRDSIARYGVGRSILIDKHNRIIGGNKTTEAAAAVGVGDVVIVETDGTKLVAVKRTDLDIDEADARMLAYADNRAGELSLNWDAGQILVDLDAGLDLGELFDDEFVNDVLEAQAGDIEPVDAEPQISKADELRGEWGVELGQIWKLGRHTVVCGDSAERWHFDKPCDQMVTDPPYGVDYSSKNEFLNKMDKGNFVQTPIQNDAIDDYHVFFESFLSVVEYNDYNTVYIFMSDRVLHILRIIAEKVGIKTANYLVWVKNNHVLGRQDYDSKHEFILYGWKGKHKFYGGHSTTLLEYNRPTKSEFHPTMKPVELIERLITDGSPAKGVVYDPFLGSGTTLLACENTNRTCYGVEISPAYVAVILQRFYDATGIMPELVKNEST
jgi:DNA modification methylase